MLTVKPCKYSHFLSHDRDAGHKKLLGHANMLQEQSNPICSEKKKKCSNSFRSSMNASTISQQNRRRSKQNTHLSHWDMCTQTEPAEFLFTCLRRYPEVPVTKDQLRLTHYNPASSEEGASPRIKTTSLHRWISPSSAVCTHSQKPSPLRLGGGTRSIVGV